MLVFSVVNLLSYVEFIIVVFCACVCTHAHINKQTFGDTQLV
jgi:hypothetical protein